MSNVVQRCQTSLGGLGAGLPTRYGRMIVNNTSTDRMSNHHQDVGTGSILALCEARRILEPELAAFAAERGSDIDHQAIREQALAMERLVVAGENFFEPDLQFHRQIALAAHNPVLARMMD